MHVRERQALGYQAALFTTGSFHPSHPPIPPIPPIPPRTHPTLLNCMSRLKSQLTLTPQFIASRGR